MLGLPLGRRGAGPFKSGSPAAAPRGACEKPGADIRMTMAMMAPATTTEFKRILTLNSSFPFSLYRAGPIGNQGPAVIFNEISSAENCES
jgi:hypothetical protein